MALFALLMASMLVATQPDGADAAMGEPLPGHLTVELLPAVAGAEVWIDHRRFEPLPYAAPIPAGWHDLTVRVPEGRRRGGETKWRYVAFCSLLVRPGERYRYEAVLDEPVEVRRERAGASMEAKRAFTATRYQEAIDGWAGVVEGHPGSCEALQADEWRRRVTSFLAGCSSYAGATAVVVGTSFLEIRTNVDAAVVTLDGNELGPTPLATGVGWTGIHRVVVAAGDGRARECLVRPAPGEDLRLEIDLPAPGAEDPPPAATLLAAADRALRDCDPETAARLRDRLLTEHPRSCEAHQLAGTDPSPTARSASVTLELRADPGWKCRLGSEPELLVEVAGRRCRIPLDASWTLAPTPLCARVTAGAAEIRAHFDSGRPPLGPVCSAWPRTVDLVAGDAHHLVLTLHDLECPRFIPFMEPYCTLNVDVVGPGAAPRR